MRKKVVLGFSYGIIAASFYLALYKDVGLCDIAAAETSTPVFPVLQFEYQPPEYAAADAVLTELEKASNLVNPDLIGIAVASDLTDSFSEFKTLIEEAKRSSQEKEKVPSYSQEELDYMTAVIYYEAGADYCSDEWQLMVGSVVMNRVADPRFPNSIYKVLTQKNQYQPFRNGIRFPANAQSRVIERARENARKILEGYRNCPETVVWQAEFKQGKGVYKIIGNTYFCY